MMMMTDFVAIVVVVVVIGLNVSMCSGGPQAIRSCGFKHVCVPRISKNEGIGVCVTDLSDFEEASKWRNFWEKTPNNG